MNLFPISARYIVSVYLIGILFFTFLRCLLVLCNLHEVLQLPRAFGKIAYAMFMGFRFDTVVSGYVLCLPALVLFISEMIGLLNKWILRSCHILLCMLYSTSFFISAADIPFYHNYSTRLNVTVLNWTSSPLFMIKMVWQDNAFLAYFLLFVVVSALFIILINMIYKRTRSLLPPATCKRTPREISLGVVSPVVLLGLMLLGIRGRTDEKSPIMAGTAYFCNDNFPNQLGLNPAFTLMWSWTDGWKDENKRLELIGDITALNYVRTYFHLPASSDTSIKRTIASAQPEQKCNVVLVIMESMSAFYLQRFGNNSGLTPNLDTLAANGYSFDNFYSAGIHTFNGIFASLYGYPALMAAHTMEGAVTPHYTGMPLFFRERGYETIYFTTHDDQFDNVGGFLSVNHMHTIISKKDYPGSEVLSTLGVPDHYMFGFSLPMLSDINKQGKPFFATYMTASNHDPFVIPGNVPFRSKHTEVRSGGVEYADWAVGNFMKEVAKMPWYNNTIFVFLGDHGASEGGMHGSMPLFYSHIPCIIYSPLFKNTPRVIKDPGGQIDVFPTVAGLLGGSYTNNTMGIDLLHDRRQWMFFSQDDKIGVADSNQLYVWQRDGTEHMYSITPESEILSANRAKADSMRTYAFSMIQCAQLLRNGGKTGLN